MMEAGRAQALREFVAESNRIAGILRDPTEAELTAHEDLLTEEYVGLYALCEYMSAVQPEALLRDRMGLDARVGGCAPPPGGPDIEERLAGLLERMHENSLTPNTAHREYRLLHPFTGGNGRSGRALWLRQLTDRGTAGLPATGFLHTWYLQTLEAPK